MVKHFNVIMAAVISGTVALFTSVLGMSGTVIGSVLSTFLYQLLSGYSEERYEEHGFSKPKLVNEIVYIFPLVVMGIIELIFVCSALHYKFDMLFTILESAVNNNLFRIMGIGLIIMGAYPFFNSNDIDKRNGIVVLVLGVLLLLRGLMDISELTSKIFYAVFAPFDMIFALFVVIALALVIINIIIRSENDYFESNEFINSHKPRRPHARKIDTSFGKSGSNLKDDGQLNYSNGLNNSNHSSNDLDNGLTSDSVNSNNSNDFDDSKNHDDSNIGSNESNQEELPLYEEELILVTNPEDPENPIRKRILKRVKKDSDSDNDDFQEVYLLDELE